MTLPIVRVVVHPDGALVTRAGKLRAQDGRVEIHKLPLLLDPTTVRVWVGGGPIDEVRTEIDLLDADRAESPALFESWREARSALSVLDAEIDATASLRSALAGLSPSFSDEPDLPLPTPARLTGWIEADRAIAERVAALDERLRAMSRRREEAAEAVAILEHDIQRASSEQFWQRWEPTRRVRLRTDAPPDSELEVELSYRIAGATWSPAYTLDTDDTLSAGRFAMRATVVQATGEDWSGVALSLSSAPSERQIDVPELEALRLGTRQPAAPTGWRPLPPDLDALFPSNLSPAPVETTRGPSADRPTQLRARELPRDGRLERRWSGETEDIVLGDEYRDEDDLSDALEIEDLPDDGVVTKTLLPPAPHRPEPAPQAAAMPEMAKRSQSIPGAVVGASLAAAAAMVAAPVAAAAALSEQRARKGAPGGGATRGRRSQADESDLKEDRLEIGTDWLMYGELRLVAWSGPVGERGRLRPVSEDQSLSERGAPPEALARLADRIRLARQRRDAAASRPLPPHHVLPAPIGGNDVRIDAEGQVDIPSDGSGHNVAVTTWPAELSVSYRTVPRHDPRAFRRVTARVQYPAPLLPGPVDVYVDGRLELTSPWKGSRGLGRLEIGLGAEDRLKVVRNVRYDETTAGLFGGSRRLSTHIEVSVASSLPRQVSVEILERVPVPLDGRELALEEFGTSPPAEPYKGEPDGPILAGGRRQVLEIKSRSDAKATFGYAVTLGARDELVGGDRRG